MRKLNFRTFLGTVTIMADPSTWWKGNWMVSLFQRQVCYWWFVCSAGCIHVIYLASKETIPTRWKRSIHRCSTIDNMEANDLKNGLGCYISSWWWVRHGRWHHFIWSWKICWHKNGRPFWWVASNNFFKSYGEIFRSFSAIDITFVRTDYKSYDASNFQLINNDDFRISVMWYGRKTSNQSHVFNDTLCCISLNGILSPRFNTS